MEYSYVSIPQLGGFVSEYKPAQILVEKNIILPPSKHISFNAELKSNDGLLINALVQKEGVSIESAEQLVKIFVKDIFVLLDDGRKVILQKLGVLRFNQQLNIEFVLEQKENFNPHSYGMTEQSFSVLSSKEIVEKKNKQFFTRKTLKYAAVIMPFLLVGTVLSIYLGSIGFLSMNIDKASFVPSIFKNEKEVTSPSNRTISEQIDDKVKQKNALAYTEPAVVLVEDKEPTKIDLTVKNEAIPEVVEKNIDSAKKEEVLKETINSKKLKYQLIAGSFKSEKNANKLLKKFKKLDIHPEIIKKGNRYRVIAASYADKNEAKKVKKELKSIKISTWINTLK